MNKNTIRQLAIASIMITAHTSRTMLTTGQKLSGQLYSTATKSIVPFVSKRALKKEYERLENEETYLFDKNKIDIKESTRLKHQKDVLTYWLRLSRTQVKNDIAKGKPYTLQLKLKEKDGVFTAKQVPIFDFNDIILHNSLLFLLRAAPTYQTPVKALKEFYAGLRRLKPKAAAKKLFPTITILDDNSTAIPPESSIYKRLENTVLIRAKDVKIERTGTYIHECQHFEQFCNGIDVHGGMMGRPIKNWTDKSSYPISCALEEEAENAKTGRHPHPKRYRSFLENDLTDPNYGLNFQLTKFPYKTPATQYADLTQRFNLQSKPAYLARGIACATLYRTLKKRIVNPKKEDQIFLQRMPLAIELIAKDALIKEWLQKQSNQYLETIDIATPHSKNYPAGCKQFLKIKQKLGLFTKE